MEKRKCLVLLMAVAIATILIIVTIVVASAVGPRPSYFNWVVNASSRKEVLTDTPSQHRDKLFISNITALDTFQHFDEDKNGKITKPEFDEILFDLFRDEFGNPHYVDTQTSTEFYSFFNKNDGIKFEDFQNIWDCWIKTIVRPVSAILVVDVQNDFFLGPPGEDDGGDVVSAINVLLDSVPFDNIFYTQEWHPTDHISFIDNLGLPGREFAKDSPIQNKADAKLFSEVVFKGPPKTRVKLKLRNNVQGTEGAKFYPELKIHKLGQIIQKGTDSNIDSYSAFFDSGRLKETELQNKLKEKGVTDVYISGLSTDEGIFNTIVDAQSLGYRTIFIQDASKQKLSAKVKEKIKSNNGIIVDSDKVKDVVQGLDRPIELGLAKALQCKKE